MKLGKRPFTPDYRDLRLASVQRALPAFPTRPFGYGTVWSDWGMLGNDSAGDCVFAGFDHEHMLFNRLAGHDVSFTTANALSDYSAVTGYNPNDPSTDQGTVVRDGLVYRKNTGLIGADGKRHKIAAFASIDPKDWNTMIRCVWTFGVVGMGFEFPQSAWDQVGGVWDVVSGSPIDGGHYVPVVGSPDTSGQATCITWGKRQVMTREFYEKYNDEAWVPLSQEALLPPSNVRHIDWAALSTYLAAL